MLPQDLDPGIAIGIIGDTHAHIEAFRRAVKLALNNSIKALVSVGDLELSQRQADQSPRFIDDLNALLEANGLNLWVVTGNHDLPSYLDRYGDWQNLPVEVAKHITYLPSGYVWSWQSWKFMALGGAYSIGGHEKPGYDSRELLSGQQLLRALQQARHGIDVVIGHDCPAGIDLASWYAKVLNRNFHKADVATGQNRWKVRRVVEAGKPSRIFHGHYHIAYQDKLALESKFTPSVTGLNCDGKPGFFCILNLQDLSVEIV
jgi:Icc-related predicted phosphoesterase